MTTQTNDQTTRRPSSRHEARDVAQAAARMMRALVRRAATGDQEALYELVQLQAVLSESITEAGRRMHEEADYSYGALAAELGISRQAARQRFGRKPDGCQHRGGGHISLDGSMICGDCHEVVDQTSPTT